MERGRDGDGAMHRQSVLLRDEGERRQASESRAPALIDGRAHPNKELAA